MISQFDANGYGFPKTETIENAKARKWIVDQVNKYGESWITYQHHRAYAQVKKYSNRLRELDTGFLKNGKPIYKIQLQTRQLIKEGE